MKKKIFISFIFISFIFILPIKAQNSYKGKVISNNNPLEYASVINKTMGVNQYTDKGGLFSIETLSNTDTLQIQCIGYVSKEIPLLNKPHELVIELEQNSELLNEVVISINNNEKGKWKKVNRKTKRFDSTYQGLAEGYNIISTYKIQEEIKFNGIRFFIMTNTLNKDLTVNNNFYKKVRPILIINSDQLDNNILPNKIIYLNKDADLFTKLDIEFTNTLHLQSGETLTIGLELMPENLEKPNINNVLGILTTKHLLKESKTYLTNLFSKKQGNLHDSPLNEDLYFELKVVK